MSLSNDELLAKCLHGKTQNNESINNIWKGCPKDIYVGQSLSMCVASACIGFNDGASGNTRCYEETGW